MDSNVVFHFDEYNYDLEGDVYFEANVKLEVSDYTQRGKALQLLRKLVEEAERKLGQAE